MGLESRVSLNRLFLTLPANAFTPEPQPRPTIRIHRRRWTLRTVDFELLFKLRRLLDGYPKFYLSCLEVVMSSEVAWLHPHWWHSEIRSDLIQIHFSRNCFVCWCSGSCQMIIHGWSVGMNTQEPSEFPIHDLLNWIEWNLGDLLLIKLSLSIVMFQIRGSCS